jgi:hypothetical protein
MLFKITLSDIGGKTVFDSRRGNISYSNMICGKSSGRTELLRYVFKNWIVSDSSDKWNSSTGNKYRKQ